MRDPKEGQLSDTEADLLDESEPEGSEAPPEAEVAVEADTVLTASQASKLRNENRSLRARLRRSEIASEFGAEVAELIPDALPLTEWPEYAKKLQALRAPTGAGESQTDAGEEPAPTGSVPTPPTEAEKRLATVSGTSHGTPAAEKISATDWMTLRQRDPGEADRVLRAGGVASAGPPNPQTTAQ